MPLTICTLQPENCTVGFSSTPLEIDLMQGSMPFSVASSSALSGSLPSFPSFPFWPLFAFFAFGPQFSQRVFFGLRARACAVFQRGLHRRVFRRRYAELCAAGGPRRGGHQQHRHQPADSNERHAGASPSSRHKDHPPVASMRRNRPPRSPPRGVPPPIAGESTPLTDK